MGCKLDLKVLEHRRDLWSKTYYFVVFAFELDIFLQSLAKWYLKTFIDLLISIVPFIILVLCFLTFLLIYFFISHSIVYLFLIVYMILLFGSWFLSHIHCVAVYYLLLHIRSLISIYSWFSLLLSLFFVMFSNLSLFLLSISFVEMFFLHEFFSLSIIYQLVKDNIIFTNTFVNTNNIIDLIFWDSILVFPCPCPFQRIFKEEVYICFHLCSSWSAYLL